MKDFNQYVEKYIEQFVQGVIQETYVGLVKYITIEPFQNAVRNLAFRTDDSNSGIVLGVF